MQATVVGSPESRHTPKKRHSFRHVTDAGYDFIVNDDCNEIRNKSEYNWKLSK